MRIKFTLSDAHYHNLWNISHSIKVHPLDGQQSETRFGAPLSPSLHSSKVTPRLESYYRTSDSHSTDKEGSSMTK